jgi:hypothetical protein
MFAVIHGSPSALKSILNGGQIDVLEWVDRTDPKLGVTPLMAITGREDEDEAIRMAKMLLDKGARADTRDTSGPGVTPLWMAAQYGKSKFVKFFLDHGAKINRQPRTNSTTQPISIAAQNGHAECVAVLAQKAIDLGQKYHLEARNKFGRTPCYEALYRGRIEMVGVLAKAGADLRCVSPPYYWIQKPHDPDTGSLIDPTHHLQNHHAVDMAVQSFATVTCVACGDSSDTIKQCGKCKLAYFCNRECQIKCWPLHRKCCAKLKKGASLFGNVDDDTPFPEPNNAPFGFLDGFTERDNHFDGPPENYDREDHPVWEYSTGKRGQREWRRYPDNIEASIESLFDMGAPKYMYSEYGLLSATRIVKKIAIDTCCMLFPYTLFML